MFKYNPVSYSTWKGRLRGPALDPTIGRSSEFRSLEFRSIQVKPGSAQSAGILNLDPKSTYHFRVVPSAGRTVGEPSKQQRIGPGTGLNGAAIAGIAEGIPCSLLALFTFTALLYLSVSYCKNTGQPKYPVSRAVEKRWRTPWCVASCEYRSQVAKARVGEVMV
ncbi:hypothetical protein NHX12_027283 [Muraenolepis orangiensis]|uniref:Uncharacterized protein n=1 Tax=Muraenolepis orangiensis TaxID=630683 RepID=A0A9Q0IP31_9TELE|nr:hypothetical protein NHX12_027283 [Muraenolepis orangiensis]